MKDSKNTLHLLTTALEQSPISIIITNVKGKIEYVNRKYTEVTGYTIEEVVGNKPNILKSDHHSRENYKKLWETITNGDEWTGEILNRKKNREIYWEQVSISPLTDGNGNVTHFVCVKNEITGFKDIEEKLQQSETKFRLLFDFIGDGIAVLNFDNIIVQCNNPLVSLCGQSTKEDIIGNKIHDLISERDHSKLALALKLTLNGPGQEFVECRLSGKEGENPDVELSIIKLLNDNDAPPGRVVVMRDISARKATDNALRASETRQQAILDAIPDIMFRISRSGEYLDESLIKKVYELFPGDIIQKSIPDINAAFKTGQIQIFEYPLTLPDGNEVYYEARFIVSGADELLVILRNITDRVNTGKELLIAKEAAESANRAKSRFLANMSHEIRTPLHSILGFIELLYRTDINEQQFEYLDIVSSSSKNLLGIINDIIDFSKIESEKLEIDKVQFDPVTEFESVINLFNVKSNEKNIHLNSFIDPRLPASVLGDPLRIKQILANLLSNAIKFTPQSGVILVLIQLAGSREDKVFITFSITDSGIGIPEYKQKIIFDAFNQSDTSITRRFGGSGLGLSICQNLVNLMGSELELESTKGHGSTFQFTLSMERTGPDDAKTVPCLDPQLRVGITVPWKESIAETVLNRYLKAFGCTLLWVSLPGEQEKMKSIDLLIHIDTENRKDNYPELFNENRPCPVLIIAHETRRPELEKYQGTIDILLYYPLFPLTLYKGIISAIGRWTGKPEEHTHSRRISEQIYNARVLLGEDNPVSQKLMIHLLKDFGIQVDIAGNGLTAYEKYCAKKYDIVFMDINMPVTDGIEATRMILEYEEKENRTHTPVIALTAKAMKNDREELIRQGMDDYLAKPFEMSELRNILDKYLAGSESVRADEGPYPDATVLENSINTDDPDSIAAAMGMTREMLKSLILEFVEISSDYLKELDDALAAEDTKHLTDSAHKLRGVSANLRLNRIMKLSESLEENSGRLSREEKQELVEKIKEQVKLIKEKFEGIGTADEQR